MDSPDHDHLPHDSTDSQNFMGMLVPPPVTEEPAEASLGSELQESESSLGVHGGQTQDRNAAIINSNHSHNLSSTTSTSNNPSNGAPTSNLSISPRNSVQQNNPSVSISMPVTPSESSPHEDTTSEPSPHEDTTSESSPHQDTKLAVTAFGAQILGGLTNVAVSSRAKPNQVILIYTLVACSTLAFLISSTALLLRKKKPDVAKKMQKAAFLIGSFGFLGIMGMLLPARITWWFTISASLVCLVMFIVATLIQ